MRDIPEPYVEPPANASATRLLTWIVSRQWRTVLLGMVLDTVWILGGTLTPWAIGKTIDEGLIDANPQALFVWVAIIAILQVGRSLMYGLRDRVAIENFERAASRVDQIIQRTQARNGIAARENISLGSLVTMGTQDASSISFLPGSLGAIGSSALALTVVGVLMINESIYLGLFTFLAVPAFTLVQLSVTNRIRTTQRAARKASAAMTNTMVDIVQGLRTIRGLGGTGWLLDIFIKRSDEARDAGYAVALPSSIAVFINTLLSGIILIAFVLVGGAAVVSGTLTSGGFVGLFGLAGYLVIPVTILRQSISVLTRADVGARAVTELLSVGYPWPDPPRQIDPAEKNDLTRKQVLLEDEYSKIQLRSNERLGVAFDSETDALMIMKRMARLTQDSELLVKRNGTDVRNIPIAQYRSMVAFSSSTPQLFSGQMRYLLDPWGSSNDDQILDALRAACAEEIVLGIHGGLDATVSEFGLSFSSGQRQRLGIARALLRRAEVLILDSPTSSLDSATEAQVGLRIAEFRALKPTVVFTNSPACLAHMDRVCFLVGGQVRSAGSHADLLQTDPGYRAICNRLEDPDD